MGLFDKAREALGQAAAAVSRETEVLSLQSQLGSVDSELSRMLSEVGKRAVELSRAGQLKDQQMEVLIRRVDELEGKMMELRQQVQDAQNKVAAPAPPPPPPPPAAPAAAPAPAPVAAGPTCARCGEALKEGAKFCGSCGAKVE